MQQNFKARIDDFINHAKSEKDLIRYVMEFFEIYAEHNLYLSANKCAFFKTKIKWCVRIVDNSGYA